jgi:hypothetical protein
MHKTYGSCMDKKLRETVRLKIRVEYKELSDLEKVENVYKKEG